VQFKFGRSFHRVSNKFIKGTTVFPSGKGKTQGTFTEEYRLPYSLICFYGIVNENAAKCTNLTESDIDLLMDGIWNGTKNLITRSKAGQMPRLLLEVIYKETNFHIGELDRLISIKSPKQNEELRDVSELSLEIGQLKSKLEKNADSISCIRYKHDDRLKLTLLDQEISFESMSDKIKFCPFPNL
jgi:CRISPR-associated protein Csh2